MNPRISAGSMWRLTGPLDRLPFVGVGLGLFAVKVALDTLVAGFVFDRPWELANYLSQQQAWLALTASDAGRPFYAVMLLLSLPFVCVGVLLTCRRLRSIGWPIGLVVLFFAPTINLLMFTVLSLLPSKAQHRRAASQIDSARTSFLDRVLPAGPRSNPTAAVGLTTAVGLLLAGFNVYGLGVYGFGLFVGLPFCLGMMAALFYGHHGVRARRGCVGVALASVFFVGTSMLLFNAEGAICLMMAAPLWLSCAALGGVVGHVIQAQARDEGESTIIIIGLALAVPAVMGAEFVWPRAAATYVVTTSVEIDAPRQQVWNHVIGFSDLPPPSDWLFHTGVAYPIRANIVGRGVGAERHCVFSTGTFVEPIDVWDEPGLLRFSVTENPPPMREWTPYGESHPPHLSGFMVSRAGQFRLTELAGGGTRLEGTTWYQHHMWPAAYWRLWSDLIIHRIHLRVLRHIADVSESAARTTPSMGDSVSALPVLRTDPTDYGAET